MSDEAIDLLRYGLYALTAISGVALIFWLRRNSGGEPVSNSRVQSVSRRITAAGQSGPSRMPVSISQPSSARISLSQPENSEQGRSMADALRGIQVPVHWQPDPPGAVGNPLTLTTTQQSDSEMAGHIARELSRLGFELHADGATSATAIRGEDHLDIEVDCSPDGRFVSTRIVLQSAPPESVPVGG